MSNVYSKRIVSSCQVCGRETKIDQFGNGKCHECGWEQSKHSVDFPDRINYPNFTSLNMAKKLFNEGKKFYPSFEDLINLVGRGFDISFYYKKKKYYIQASGKRVDTHENLPYVLYAKGDETSIFESKTVVEFSQTAKLDGLLLKDIWHNTSKVEFEC